MNSLLVWILVTISGSNTVVMYSPPVTDLESCQRMEKFVRDPGGVTKTKCVQIKITK